MVTYTNNDYIVSFDSTNPSANVKKIVHSLADNVSQLSIYEENEATSTTYYSAKLKYSGHSKLVLKFGVHEGTCTDKSSIIQLRLTIGAEDLNSQGNYDSEYWLEYTNNSDGYVSSSYRSKILELNKTENSFKYTVLAFDDAIYLVFKAVKTSSGVEFQDLGAIFLSPFVDQFTSEKIGGCLYWRPYHYYGTGMETSIKSIMHNGKATQSYTSNYVVVGGTNYYAGANSVASPIVWKSDNYASIPFYGFANNSEFLYQIRTGSSSDALNIGLGAKVEIGGHTFVCIRMCIGLFVRIS